MRPYLRT
jgi:leucyl-tRNA synthetase